MPIKSKSKTRKRKNPTNEVELKLAKKLNVALQDYMNTISNEEPEYYEYNSIDQKLVVNIIDKLKSKIPDPENLYQFENFIGALRYLSYHLEEMNKNIISEYYWRN